MKSCIKANTIGCGCVSCLSSALLRFPRLPIWHKGFTVFDRWASLEQHRQKTATLLLLLASEELIWFLHRRGQVGSLKTKPNKRRVVSLKNMKLNTIGLRSYHCLYIHVTLPGCAVKCKQKLREKKRTFPDSNGRHFSSTITTNPVRGFLRRETLLHLFDACVTQSRTDRLHFLHIQYAHTSRWVNVALKALCLHAAGAVISSFCNRNKGTLDPVTPTCLKFFVGTWNWNGRSSLVCAACAHFQGDLLVLRCWPFYRQPNTTTVPFSIEPWNTTCHSLCSEGSRKVRHPDCSLSCWSIWNLDFQFLKFVRWVKQGVSD